MKQYILVGRKKRRTWSSIERMLLFCFFCFVLFLAVARTTTSICGYVSTFIFNDGRCWICMGKHRSVHFSLLQQRNYRIRLSVYPQLNGTFGLTYPYGRLTDQLEVEEEEQQKRKRLLHTVSHRRRYPSSRHNSKRLDR